jgi:hypothetical protein
MESRLIEAIQSGVVIDTVALDTASPNAGDGLATTTISGGEIGGQLHVS